MFRILVGGSAYSWPERMRAILSLFLLVTTFTWLIGASALRYPGYRGGPSLISEESWPTALGVASAEGLALDFWPRKVWFEDEPSIAC